MQTIIIQAVNNRGTEKRISTKKNEIKLTVFFKGESSDIRKEILIIKRTDGGSLRVENLNGLLWQSEGDEAEKLPNS